MQWIFSKVRGAYALDIQQGRNGGDVVRERVVWGIKEISIPTNAWSLGWRCIQLLR